MWMWVCSFFWRKVRTLVNTYISNEQLDEISDFVIDSLRNNYKIYSIETNKNLHLDIISLLKLDPKNPKDQQYADALYNRVFSYIQYKWYNMKHKLGEIDG